MVKCRKTTGFVQGNFTVKDGSVQGRSGGGEEGTDEDGCGMDNPQEKSVRVCGYGAFIKNLLFF